MSYTLDQVIKTALETVTTRPIGYGTVPSEYPEKPYGVLYPMENVTPLGDMSSVVANRDYKYQIRCVGEDHRQVRWMQAKVELAMLGVIAAAGAQWVLPEGTSAIVPDGADLYSSLSTFCVRM
jgi:hypothetical protein